VAAFSCGVYIVAGPAGEGLSVPAAAAGGPFSLAVGMYRPDTLERLPVTGPDGPLPKGRILLSIP